MSAGTRHHPGAGGSPARGRTRGAVGVGMVAAMVMLGVFMVAGVVAGVRDQDLTVQRQDAARAWYAAEAAINMALREVALDVDEDGDGGIGSISDDGKSTNDPSLGPARLRVSRTVAGAGVVLTADARSGTALRRTTVHAEPRGSVPRRVFYSQWPQNRPYVRTWTGTEWLAPSAGPDLGAQQYWIVAQKCPVRAEWVLAASVQNDRLRCTVQRGNTWGSVLTASNNLGTTSERPFYVAWESLSGRAVLVYRVGNNATIYYRVWNGSAWTGQQSWASPTGAPPRWLRLVPAPGSDDMLLLMIDTADGAAVALWNGAQFRDAVVLTPRGPSGAYEWLDGAFLSASGRALVLWGLRSSGATQCLERAGGLWGVTKPGPTVSASPRWVRLVPEPGSDRALAGILDSGRVLSMAVWSGSGWGTSMPATPAAATAEQRCFDVAFRATGEALVAYGGQAGRELRYRVWHEETWSGEQVGPAFQQPPLLVQMSAMPNWPEIMIAVLGDANQRGGYCLRWDGQWLTDMVELGASVPGGSRVEAFMVTPAGAAVRTGATVRAWTQTAPQ